MHGRKEPTRELCWRTQCSNPDKTQPACPNKQLSACNVTHLQMQALLLCSSFEGVVTPQLVKGAGDYKHFGHRRLLGVLRRLLLLLLLCTDDV